MRPLTISAALTAGAFTVLFSVIYGCATAMAPEWPTEEPLPLANAAEEVAALEQPVREVGPDLPEPTEDPVEVLPYFRERDIKDIPAEDDTEGQIVEDTCTPTICTLPHVPEAPEVVASSRGDKTILVVLIGVATFGIWAARYGIRLLRNKS